MAALSVAIVNDYPVVVRGLDAMLEPYADRVRVAELDVRQVPRRPVDVTLYDTFAAVRGVCETVEDLVADPHVGKVLLYSWSPPREEVEDALARGCAGYVDKSVTAEELVTAIERAAAGERSVLLGVAPPRLEWPQGSWPGREVDLSPREAEVMALITRGLTNQDIGHRLHLSVNTVKTYIRSAYGKAGVTRRSQAVKWGIQHGMLPDVGGQRQ